MQKILRILILTSIIYVPGVCAMQQGQSIQDSYLSIKKSFESIKQHPSQDSEKVYQDMRSLQGRILNLVPKAPASGVENLDRDTKALRDELLAWTKYSYSAIKARFEKLKAKPELTSKDKSNLSKLCNNDITQIIIEGHTEQEGQALCAEITKRATEEHKKQMGTLSGPATTPEAPTAQDQAQQKHLKAKERLENAHAGKGSELDTAEWEDCENSLEKNSKEKAQAKALRMKLFQEAFEKFKKDKTDLSPKDLAEVYTDYLARAAYFANRYNDDKNVGETCAKIQKHILADASPDVLKNMNTSALLPSVTSSSTQATSPVAPAIATHTPTTSSTSAVISSSISATSSSSATSAPVSATSSSASSSTLAQSATTTAPKVMATTPARPLPPVPTPVATSASSSSLSAPVQSSPAPVVASTTKPLPPTPPVAPKAAPQQEQHQEAVTLTAQERQKELEKINKLAAEEKAKEETRKRQQQQPLPATPASSASMSTASKSQTTTTSTSAAISSSASTTTSSSSATPAPVSATSSSASSSALVQNPTTTAPKAMVKRSPETTAGKSRAATKPNIAALSWFKKLGLGALTGTALYISYALANVYKHTTRSMVGYKGLNWFGKKFPFLYKNSKGRTMLLAGSGLAAAGMLSYVAYELYKLVGKKPAGPAKQAPPRPDKNIAGE